MHALFRGFKTANAGSLFILVIIVTFLLAGGANSAAGASMLSAFISAALLVSALAAPRRDLAHAAASNWLSLLAGSVFVLLAFASAWPGLAPFAAPHPLWSMLGEGPSPLSLSPYRTLEGVTAFLGAGAAFFLGALLAPDRTARDWLGRWLITLSIVYTMAALYLYFVIGQSNGQRLDAAISSANAAAALFGVLAIYAGAMIVRGARGRLGANDSQSLAPGLGWATFMLKAPLAFAALLLLFACLLLTASRGGLIATALAFILFSAALLAQNLKNASLRNGALFAPLIVCAGVFAILFARGGGDVLERFALAEQDLEIRRMLADAHWQRFLERPLFGHGLNTYHELNTLSATPENWTALRSPGSAHNIFIQVLEETGLVGLGLWALMFCTPLLRALARIAGKRSGSEWAAAALAATALLLLHGLVDFAMQVPAIAVLYAFVVGASIGRSQPVHAPAPAKAARRFPRPA